MDNQELIYLSEEKVKEIINTVISTTGSKITEKDIYIILYLAFKK